MLQHYLLEMNDGKECFTILHNVDIKKTCMIINNSNNIVISNYSFFQWSEIEKCYYSLRFIVVFKTYIALIFGRNVNC